MAASEPTSWLFEPPHLLLSTRRALWGLNRRSGLFPSRPRNLSPADRLPGLRRRHSEFGGARRRSTRPSPHRWLYLRRRTAPRLAQELFRGEPAITRLDWNFTTSHGSSAVFSSWPWLDRRVSGLPVPTRALFGLGFPAAPRLPLSLAGIDNSQAHSSIGTTSGFDALGPVAGMRFQDLFIPLPGFFSPFPHGTCSLSVTGLCLALAGGPAVFRRGFS